MLESYFESNVIDVNNSQRLGVNNLALAEQNAVKQKAITRNITLILAIGNLLMTDEGAGIHVLNYLIKNQTQPSENIIFLDGGTLSFSLAAHIQNSDNLIVIDAAELNQSPGFVKTFVGTQMDQQLGHCKLSVHEVGLIDLMDMVKLGGHLPKNRALVGIQPLTIADWSVKPSVPVTKAIPLAAEQVSNLIKEWHQHD